MFSLLCCFLFVVGGTADLSVETQQRQRQTQFRPSSLFTGSKAAENVTILAYNVNHLHYLFQLTYRPRNEGPRLRRINAAIKLLGVTPPESAKFGRPDVLVLSEVMSNAANSELSKLIEVYPYQTPRLGNECDDVAFDTVSGCKGLLLNGGVKILSRWPILETHALVFTNRMNGDKLVNKGAIHVAISTPRGRVFHVVGTHMQSTATELQKVAQEEKAVRRRQMSEIRSWLKERPSPVPANESVFLAGDLNVEFGSPEFRNLKSAFPEWIVDYEPDPTVGGSFSARFRNDRTNWLTAYHLYGSNVSRMDETLDYVSYFGDYRVPGALTRMEVLPVKSLEAWSWWRMKGDWNIEGEVYRHDGVYRDLSDHYPVVQKFWLDG